MLYLIISSAMRVNEDGKKEYFDILKIGYTEDSRKDKRFDQYFLHNPTCKIIATIPNATQEQESRVQYKFKDLLYTRNEWFKYDQSIIDFFNNVKSLEELDKLPKNPIRGDKEILERKRLARKILGYVIDPANKTHKEIKREIEDYINSMINVLGDKIDEESIIDYLRNNNDIDSSRIDYYLECKERKLTNNYSDDPKINQEVEMFFKNYEQLTTMKAKLRLLCECGLPSSAIDIILSQIQDSDDIKSYYITIGPNRLYELGYNVTKIKRELGILLFNPLVLENEIYFVFKEGNKYSLSTIKDMLTTIYNTVNYKKTPKAIDICNYFEIKKCKVSIVGGKRENGYELIKKLH